MEFWSGGERGAVHAAAELGVLARLDLVASGVERSGRAVESVRAAAEGGVLARLDGFRLAPLLRSEKSLQLFLGHRFLLFVILVVIAAAIT